VSAPPAEHVHWLFATGILLLGLFLLAEAIVGTEVWRKRPWRPYLWPSFAFAMGLAMWLVMVSFTSSTIHMLAHSVWAQALMFAGAAELGLVRGKLHSPAWRLASPLAILVSGLAFLVHEQNPWLFQRSAFLHHLMGWTLVVGTVIVLARALRPRWAAANAAFAILFVALAVMLYSDRDTAPVFGHLDPLAGEPRR
jgi:hypothetical protein